MTIQTEESNSLHKIVVLNILSANGFGLIKGSIIINATLKGLKLQTPMIVVNDNNIKVNINLRWFIDKFEFKKLRMYNESIKIECFQLPFNDPDNFEKLGYLLLKIKGAQIIQTSSSCKIENNIYKLMGTKNGKYEMTLSLRIEDNNPKITELKLKKSLNFNIENNSGERVHHEEDLTFNNNAALIFNETQILEQPEIILKNESECSAAQERNIKELENWMNKQIALFDEKIKILEEHLVKKLKCNCVEEKKHFENELAFQINQFKECTKSVDKLVVTLKEKEAQIASRELELDSYKNNLNDIIHNLQSSLLLNNAELNTTTLETKHAEKSNDEIQSKFSIEILQLKNALIDLEKQYGEAHKSQMFYKECWSKAVRELNHCRTQLYRTEHNNHILNKTSNVKPVIIDKHKKDENVQHLLKELIELKQKINKTTLNNVFFS
ncbi:repetitive organellar protein-like [Daktulosphaira vitifoliae]|uniref:repetitive organellar protein-like n=1 Tax=Daktulosphaira vitifoliae TaxID=58002 RepID=UPI0021AA8CEC|nr:repetitive organellar protein-like [Daktulosphaira vitifoliae]XP_050534285.1 repetitive organellar protein-like [Daktulosphaira vitifoliae]